MLKQLKERAIEVVKSILPLVLLVVVMQFTVLHMPPGTFLQFIFGAVLVMVGMILFLLGVDVGILPMGQAIGSELPRRAKFPYLIAVTFLIGVAVTIAEPDVIALSHQVDQVTNAGVSHTLLVGVIAIGVGFFVTAAIVRIILGFPIAYLLAAGYITVLVLSFFTPAQFMPVAFDAGGVTTGPVTVPVILALGIGFSSVLSGKSPISDGFGLIGLASIGPVIGVMIMGMVLY